MSDRQAESVERAEVAALREALETSQTTLETVYRMNTHGSVHEFDWENGGVGDLIKDQIKKNKSALAPPWRI